MNTYLKTMIGCGLGLASAYAIGRLSFEIGRDIERLNQITSSPPPPPQAPDIQQKATTEMAEVPTKRRLFGRSGGLASIKDIIKRPENHAVEAYIEGNETVFRIKRRQPARKLQTT